MAIEGTLDNVFVGTDHGVVYTNYNAAQTEIVEMAGWTVVLDIRATDTKATALLSVTGVISGTFNSDPDVNTQVCTFTLSDDDLSDTVFPALNAKLRYSIKRTDTGSETVLRYGTITLNRVTQT